MPGTAEFYVLADVAHTHTLTHTHAHTHTDTLPKQGVHRPDEIKVRMKTDEGGMTMKVK